MLCIAIYCVIFPTQAYSTDEYRLGAGDTIKITVFGQQDLSIETMLDDSGKIDYPFLGQIQASGQTLEEFQQQIHTVA